MMIGRRAYLHQFSIISLIRDATSDYATCPLRMTGEASNISKYTLM